MNRKLNAGIAQSETAILLSLAVAKLLFHLLHPEYGYFRDELYYLAVSDGFSLQNLDVLPLTPVFLKLWTAVFGDSLKALHAASGLCGALSLVIAGLITRKLGGRRYAVLLTGLFVFFSGFLPFGALFTYDSLDFLIQTWAIYLLVRIVKEDDQKLWILLGITLGVGLLNKLSILAFGLALCVSLLLVPQRVTFKRMWIWLAAAIALVGLIPFVVWQSLNGWYFLDFVAGYSGGISYVMSFPQFLWNQILPNGIWGFPVWATGLGLLLFSSRWRPLRLFGFMYLFLFLLFFVLGVKFYFLVPMYVILFAVGSIKLEEVLRRGDAAKDWRTAVRGALPVAYVVLSLPVLPMAVPILPVERLVDYLSVFGVNAGIRTETSAYDELPHHFADRFGWPEMVDQVAGAYDEAKQDSPDGVGILTQNYGQAGAIQLFGKDYNLPEPVSPYSWFYFEALRTHEFQDRYVSVGFSRQEMTGLFEEVTQQDVVAHPYALPHENNRPILLCSGPRYDLREYWKVHAHMDARFRGVLEDEGVAAAVDFYHRHRDSNASKPLWAERQMNELGYVYLRDGKIPEAIALFQLNVEAYPGASNTYDSLGEAFMEAGQRDEAILHYKKSLELNPQNDNAKRMLRRMGVDV